MSKLIILVSVLCLSILLFAVWYKVCNDFVKILNENPSVFDVKQLQFKQYLKDFNKSYNVDEYDRRFQNFKASLKEIARLNHLEGSRVFGLTKFSDLSKEEFLKRYTMHAEGISCYPRSKSCGKNRDYDFEERNNYSYVQSSFDWRDRKGTIGPVLDQKRCLGCWAFSIVGNMESMSAIRGIDYKQRSIQELIDCADLNNGCMGGNVATALQYLCGLGTPPVRVVTEEEYPLTLATERCKLSSHPSGRTVKNFHVNCDMEKKKMVELIVNHGPLIIVVDATNWQNYIGGIIQRACSNAEMNHVVQLIGYYNYKVDYETPYFVIKNSWGEDFGDNGYVKVAISDENICGVQNQVTYLDIARNDNDV